VKIKPGGLFLALGWGRKKKKKRRYEAGQPMRYADRKPRLERALFMARVSVRCGAWYKSAVSEAVLRSGRTTSVSCCDCESWCAEEPARGVVRVYAVRVCVSGLCGHPWGPDRRGNEGIRAREPASSLSDGVDLTVQYFLRRAPRCRETKWRECSYV